MTERWWEDEFKDFYWEQGKYADRQLGIHGYIEFIKNIEDKATTEESSAVQPSTEIPGKLELLDEEALEEHICWSELANVEYTDSFHRSECIDALAKSIVKKFGRVK